MIVNKLEQKLSSDYDPNIIPYDRLYGRGTNKAVVLNLTKFVFILLF